MWITTPKYFNDPYDCALFIDSSNIKNKFFETDDLADLDKELEPYKLEGKMIEAKSRIKELEPEFEKLKEQLNRAYLEEDRDKNRFLETHNLADLDKESKLYKSIEKILEIGCKNIIKEFEPEFEKLKEQLAIACLTEDNDNILMWSHYACNHKGICLEYDFEEILDTVQNIYPVIYKDEIYDLSNDIMNQTVSGLLKGVLNKSKAWEYEKEWRIPCNNPNRDAGCLIRFPKVKSIYLGCKLEESDKETIIKLAKEKSINLYQMKMEKGKYKLIAEKIELNISNL